jgi:hypothetical protein
LDAVHIFGVPLTQTWFWHVSDWVQALPSLQVALSASASQELSIVSVLAQLMLASKSDHPLAVGPVNAAVGTPKPTRRAGAGVEFFRWTPRG